MLRPTMDNQTNNFVIFILKLWFDWVLEKLEWRQLGWILDTTI